MDAPDVDVLVATRDEAAQIHAKLHNLAALDYPVNRLRILVIDGGSSDATVARSRAAAAALDRRIDVIEIPRAGKMANVKAGLDRGNAPWILVTDADARLAPDALRAMLAAASAPGVAVVGAPVAVRSAYVPEQIHWALSNTLRRLEDRFVGSSGLVAGPCYLARRSLLAGLPDDAVADDLHLVCRAAAAGLGVRMAGPPVWELRSAQSLTEYVHHKHRKAQGYLREVAMAWPSVIGARGSTARAFRARLLALAALPLAAVSLLAAAAAGFASAPGLTAALAGVLAAPGLGLRLPKRLRALGLVSWVVLTGLILLVAAATWPFARLTSAHPRQGSINRQAREPDAAA